MRQKGIMMTRVKQESGYTRVPQELCIMFQTLKHVQDMFDFNTTSNSYQKLHSACISTTSGLIFTK